MPSDHSPSDDYVPLLRHAMRMSLKAAGMVSLVPPLLVIIWGGAIASSVDVSKSVEVLLMFTITAAIMGAAPLMLWGVPAYAYAAYRGANRWPVALGIGIVPALLALAASPYTAALYLVYGGATALLAHVLFIRTPRPNADASLHVTPRRSASPSVPSLSSPPPSDPSAMTS